LAAGARALGKRVLLAGQGFGPLRRSFNHGLCRWVLPKAECVLVRDEPGRTWCREHGVKENRLCLGADWVWTLPVPPPKAGRDWAVCLRADVLRSGEPSWLADFLDLATAQKKRVRFLVLGNGGDRECLAKAGNRVVLEKDIIDVSGLSWQQALTRVQGLEWVLSLRYHGLILGAAAGAAVAGWGNDAKLGNLLQELQAPDLRELVGAEALKLMLAQGAAARKTQLVQVSKLRCRAQNMADQVRSFLKIR
jgi:polysaccharide pyruvyl transferase WcaK-like protein